MKMIYKDIQLIITMVLLLQNKYTELWLKKS